MIKPEGFYIIIDVDLKYKFKKCSAALDCLFKIFFSVDCSYPKHSETLWLFIQRAVYGIYLPEDKINSSLNILLGQLKEFVNINAVLNNSIKVNAK